MATFSVVVPVKGAHVNKTRNNKGELVGIPFLGQSERFIFNEVELSNWLYSFIVGTSESSMVYIERHPESDRKDWTDEVNKHEYETPRGASTVAQPCAVCGLNYGHWTHHA